MYANTLPSGPVERRVDARFGSEADFSQRQADVRFTPNSGHWTSVAECLLYTKSRHSGGRDLKLWAEDMRRSKQHGCSIDLVRASSLVEF